MLRLLLKILEDIVAKIDAEWISRAHLNIPSNGSIKGSHASKCLLNVDAAIEHINTAFIVSNFPWVARFIFAIVVSKGGVTYKKLEY